MPSIEKRGNNTYRLTISCGKDSYGKRLMKRKNIELSEDLTEKQKENELKKQLALFQNEVEKGTYLDAGKITFKEFSDKWLIDYAEKNLTPNTLRCYKMMIKDRIIPALGHIKLDKLQPNHLLEFYNNLSEPGISKSRKSDKLSTATIQKYHRIISSILSSAVQWQLIFSNPASRVKPPKLQRKEAQSFDDKQIILLIEALDTQPLKYKVLIMLALVTGLRRGELVALEWKNVKLDSAIIEVKHSAQYIPGEGVSIKDPKNKSSIRKIMIPDIVTQLLKKHRESQITERLKIGDAWEGDDWIFTQLLGEIMHPDTPTKYFKKFLKEYNEKVMSDDEINKKEKENYLLPEINFHSLRHSAATLLIHKGLNVKAVSSHLGHANSSTTLNIYSHAIQSAEKEVANIMQDMLSVKDKPNKSTNKKQA